MIGIGGEGSGSDSYGNGGISGISGLASISNYGGSSSSAGAMANLQRYHGQHHNGSVAISQLYIDVAEHHINSNGRLEITCLATIPAHVAVGEQFADYKTHSVKSELLQYIKCSMNFWTIFPFCIYQKIPNYYLFPSNK